ncbi:MAG: hypothetical protein NVSMB1_15160 [Polyangiales bacterium]
MAARLKDADIAAAALAAAAKGGDLKSWSSKALDVTVYEQGSDFEVAIFGDMVIAADTRDALESAGKYVAYRSAKGNKLDHDATLRMPLSKYGPRLRDLGKDGYAKVNSAIPPKLRGALDALVGPLLDGVADMGDAAIHLDVEGGYLKMEEKIAAKGAFSRWLATYPSGDVSPMLSMPKGEGVGLVRFPDGLGPLLDAAIEQGAEEAKALTPADRVDLAKQVRVLGKSLGHEFAYSHKSAVSGKAGPYDSEYVLRIDLTDGAAAVASRGALSAIRKHLIKASGAPASAVTVTPYKKNGADGETVSFSGSAGMGASASSGPKDNVTFAIKGNYFYLDACIGCVGVLLDPALDPSSKNTWADDAAAKAKVASYPAKDLISASYADAWSFPKVLLGRGAGVAGGIKNGTPMWGWSTSSTEGLVGKGGIPLSFVGEMGRVLLSMVGPGSYLGAPPVY